MDQLRFSFYGEDRLQSLKYAIDFNSVQQISKDAQWHVESQLLRPLSIALSSKTVGYEQRYYQFYSDYLLYRFDGKGIQNISLISKASRYFNRTDYAVGTSILFKTPLFSQTLSLETRLNQTSHKWSIRHKQPLRSSIFSYHFTTYYNYLFKVPSRSQNPFYIQDRSGHTHELDLSIPVYSINKGSWSPNIWLNTLVFTPFFDFTHIDRASTNLWHYGTTLSLNVHHSLSSHNVIYIGYSKNNFDETEYFYGISIL